MTAPVYGKRGREAIYHRSVVAFLYVCTSVQMQTCSTIFIALHAPIHCHAASRSTYRASENTIVPTSRSCAHRTRSLDEVEPFRDQSRNFCLQITADSRRRSRIFRSLDSGVLCYPGKWQTPHRCAASVPGTASIKSQLQLNIVNRSCIWHSSHTYRTATTTPVIYCLLLPRFPYTGAVIKPAFKGQNFETHLFVQEFDYPVLAEGDPSPCVCSPSRTIRASLTAASRLSDQRNPYPPVNRPDLWTVAPQIHRYFLAGWLSQKRKKTPIG